MKRKAVVGERVRVLPHCDLYMRGARFGTVVTSMSGGRLRVRLQVGKGLLVVPMHESAIEPIRATDGHTAGHVPVRR